MLCLQRDERRSALEDTDTFASENAEKNEKSDDEVGYRE